MRKPLVDMPKNLKRNCPSTVKDSSVTNEMNVALLTMARRCGSAMSCVMVRNISIVPRGLVRVKNDVRQRNANASIDVSGIVGLCFYWLKVGRER